MINVNNKDTVNFERILQLFVVFSLLTLNRQMFSRAISTAWKLSKYGVISGPNTGKYGPEVTPYLDTFHAV